MLLGREVERGHLARMLDDAQHGIASTVLVRGEPGMGKSALLTDLAVRADAAGMRVLRTAGMESEAALPFAALHRLLRPALGTAVGGMDGLPAPQRRALQVAFGQADGDQTDPFLVALGTLSLLTEMAESAPVLCLVDDLQWLDAVSRDALLFAARRLLAEPVAMVFAARDEGGDALLAGPEVLDVPQLPLPPLGPSAVRALVEERSGAPVSDEVLGVLAARTGGNPLAVVELPSRLTAEQLAGTVGLPEELPLTARVERAFLDRCRRLSREGQTLMLLAAADDAVQLTALRRAAATLEVTQHAFDEVEAAGLLVSDGDRLQVRHPLVRSAVYQAATSAERRAAHAALADALAVGRSAQDHDRQVWHRAAAAAGPDAAVADELAAAGSRAESRGGHEAASAAYERAAQLSDRDPVRAQRLFDAARTAYAAGRADRTTALLAQARPVADDRPLRAAIDRLRARVEVAAGSAVDAHRLFVSAARDVAEVSPVQALEMAAYAGVLRSHGVDSGATLPPGTVSTVVEDGDSARVRSLRLLLDATQRQAAGDWTGAIAVLHTALDGGRDAEDRDVWSNLANMSLHLGDEAAHRSFFTTTLSAARTDGAVMEVLYALQRLCLSQYAAGDWAAVRRSADEAVSLARSIGQPSQGSFPLAWLTLLAALQGADGYDDLLARTQAQVAGGRLGVMDGFVSEVLRWAQATRAGHAGDTAGALHHFAHMQDGLVTVVTQLAAAPRILAAVQAGDRDRAQQWTGRIEAFAAASDLPWAHGVAAYGRALLAQGAEATELFEQSLVHHAAAHRPYDAASARLAFGEHLRRLGRRVDARAHLKDALETFRDLGAEPLVQRAAAELRASGETARKRDPSTLTQLTPTELRIAQLVAQGLSNKDVAEACWISPRTVAFHLRGVFAKTGVTSRSELAHLGLS